MSKAKLRITSILSPHPRNVLAFDEKLAVSPTLLLVREAVANAVHHGEAETVHISITDTDGTRTIRSDDDGKGPQAGSPGSGSQTLDSLTSFWSLNPNEQGGSSLIAKTGSV